MSRFGAAALGALVGVLLLAPLVLAVVIVIGWLSAVHIDGTGWTALLG